MERFVENEQFGVFHECTGKQYQSLFTAGEFEECAFLQSLQSKDVHPEAADAIFLFRGFHIKTDAIFQTAGNDAHGRQVAKIGAVHLR